MMDDFVILDDLFIPDVEFDERRENDAGSILIGGDRGDVWASWAYATPDRGGVMLVGTRLYSGCIPEDRVGKDLIEWAREAAREVIQQSYESIGAETFWPSTKND